MTTKKVTETAGRVFSYARWSSEKQSAGDSERRQIEAAETWCQRHGTRLSDEKFIDRGISAREGKNRLTGNLGRLVETVQEGDVLLVEDNDRLSRQDWFAAMALIKQITDKGVKVVTLANNNEITAESFRRDPGCFLPAIMRSFQGNDENEKRVFRVREAMKHRRQKVESGIAVKGVMPCWLKWEGDKATGKVIVVESKAKSVRKLFELSIAGNGVQTMLVGLLRLKVPCPTNCKRGRWNTRTIYRLLTGKAVIGWHEPSNTPGVYPVIVSEADYYASREKISARSNLTAPVKHANNSLFTGLCKCSECGGSMIKTGNGKTYKNYAYLTCANGTRGEDKSNRCKAGSRGFRYDYFEASFLALLSRTDLVYKALAVEKQASPVDALRGELQDVQKQCDKLLRLIDGDDSPSRRLTEKLKVLETREAELQEQISIEEARAKATVPSVEAYNRYVSDLADHATQPEFRGKIREALHEIVEKIVLDAEEGTYEVQLKQAKMPITVLVTKTGYLFNPSPRVAVKAAT